jgi:hypothetical protein
MGDADSDPLILRIAVKNRDTRELEFPISNIF